MNNLYHYKNAFELESGEQLNELKIAYTDSGKSTNKKVVWVCHALSGNADVFEWWPGLFGDNQIFNSSEYRIICANVIGSCYGSTSPADYENPQKFPFLTIKDIVKAHQLLAEELNIQKIDILIGASLGGQQALEWNLTDPNKFDKLILIATNAKHSAYGRAFNEAQRLAIESDLTFGMKDGGQAGLKAARAIAMISYRSYQDFEIKQSESAITLKNYKAASYIRYQGQKFVERFNPYSYYLLTKAMDSHDIRRGRGNDLAALLSTVKSKTLVVGIDSDTLFPLQEQRLLASHIPNANLGVIKSVHGHDAFLIEYEKLNQFIEEFLTNEFKTYRTTTLKRNYSLN